MPSARLTNKLIENHPLQPRHRVPSNSGIPSRKGCSASSPQPVAASSWWPTALRMGRSANPGSARSDRLPYRKPVRPHGICSEPWRKGATPA